MCLILITNVSLSGLVTWDETITVCNHCNIAENTTTTPPAETKKKNQLLASASNRCALYCVSKSVLLKIECT